MSEKTVTVRLNQSIYPLGKEGTIVTIPEADLKRYGEDVEIVKAKAEEKKEKKTADDGKK